MADAWIKFFPSDFLGGTGGLTAAERGVYITILCLIYENEGPIPMDEGRLSRRCGVTKAAFVRAFGALSDEGKLTLSEGLIDNNRSKKLLSERAIRSQKASASASQRWNALPEKSEQKQQSENANASAKQCETDANQNQNQIVGSELDKSNPPPTSGGGFSDEDWSRVIRAVGYDPELPMPQAWVSPNGAAHSWIESGLSIDQIVIAAQDSRKHHHEPPETPQALNGAMARAVGSKPQKKSSPIEMARFWAEKINSGAFVAPSSINAGLARLIVSEGLATEAALAEKGIHV